MNQTRIDRALQLAVALSAALMAASASAPANHPWPTLVLFAVALSHATFSAVSSRVVGAAKPIEVLDIIGYVGGALAQFAVPTAQAFNYALPSWAVVVVAIAGGMLGVSSHGPLAPKAGQ